MTVAAPDSSGTTVWFDVSATDNVSVTSGPTCSHAPGSFFPVGTTTVTCTSTDAVGNIGTASFTVTVTFTDVTPPVVNVPDDITVAEGSGTSNHPHAGTTFVQWSIVTATDESIETAWNITCTNELEYTPQVPDILDVGGFFLPGTYILTCTASDAAGNTKTESFTVTVVPEPETPPAPTPAPTH